MLPEIVVRVLLETEQLQHSIMIGAVLGTLLFCVVCRIRKRKLESALQAYDLLIDRLDNYNPEELVPGYDIKDNKVQIFSVDESDKYGIDLAKVNYLNMLNSQQIKDSAIECIVKYGVGTCGPRGFLGTTEVHIELEKKLAEFLHVEDAIIYSCGFAAPSNAICAYCKKNDVIFYDEKINFALQTSLLATKSTIVCFKHNDVDDFCQKLKDAAKIKSPLCSLRKFLVIEGIYSTTGAICPLPDILALAKMHKVRVFVDESVSFGILGPSGRGITEHFHIDINEVDMIIGSLEGALGSIGSFCAGSKAIIEHQRLSSAGYVYTASLVTYQAQAALMALNMIDNSSEALWYLHLLSQKVHLFLSFSSFYTVLSSPESPCKVFTSKLKKKRRQWEKEICNCCQVNGVYLRTNNNGLVMHLNIALFYQESKLLNLFEVLEFAALNVKV